MSGPTVRRVPPLGPSDLPAGSAGGATRAVPPSRGNRVAMMALVGVVSLVWAAVCNGMLDLLQSGGDLHRLLTQELVETGVIFLISTGVVWLLVLLLLALTNRLFLSLGLALCVAVGLGWASYLKITLRREPVYPSDLVFVRQAGFLSDMVDPRTLVAAGLVIGLLLAVVLLVGRVVSRSFPPIRRRTEPRRWRTMLLLRVLTVVLVTAALSYVTHFNSSGNRVREAYNHAGADWAWWSQTDNYGRHGFVAGFLYNLNVPAMDRPEDYSAATMATLSTKYARRADRLNSQRVAGAADDVNVVVVLSEAFSDPTLITGPTLAEDPIPFTRSLMASTTSGEMLAQLFGGGTANMEFEALSGMSLSQFLPQMNTPYQMLVTQTPTFPSVVGLLGAQGWQPLAVHPFRPTMYKRHEVYPILGFSEFIHDSTMQHADRIDDNNYVSDAAAFDEVEYQLARSTKPAFVNLVTMQNHYPMAGKYHDPIPVTGVSGEVADQLSHYARGLRHTDDALRDFIGDLERSDEKTAVIFYGDHAPAFWSGEVYDSNGADSFRRTPYFIWTNFTDLPRQSAPVTSPIYFLPTLFNELSAPLPPYYVLLTELQQEIPAMEQGEYYLPDGSKVSEDALGPRARALLHDYRLVQYDLAVGQRYSESVMFPQGSDVLAAGGSPAR